ncbi:hypothetical protein ACS0TY_023097 [Phlomoides rotata]
MRFIFREGVEDSWRWRISEDGKYSTKATYIFLLSQISQTIISEELSSGFKLIWKNYAPLKVIAHAWRLLWDRLPTKCNLQRRNILGLNDVLSFCFCNLEVESGKHIFFECSVTYQIWTAIFVWLGFPMAMHSGTLTNLLMFSNFFRRKRGKHVAVSIWLGTVWIIWKWRNALIFKNDVASSKRILDELKSRLWSWLIIKYPVCSNFSFRDWIVNPRSILEDL